MTPLDRVPDQRPVPAGTGLTLEDALPAPVESEADGVSARPRLARTVAEMRSAPVSYTHLTLPTTPYV